MKQLLTLLSLISALNLSAQTKKKSFFVGNVIADKNSFKVDNPNKELESILDSKNNIEIRFISSPSLYSYKNYLVITYNYHKDWTINWLKGINSNYGWFHPFDPTLKTFSTDQAAKDWITWNKPQHSLAAIMAKSQLLKAHDGSYMFYLEDMKKAL